jgi:type IV pilus assembly protein PilV
MPGAPLHVHARGTSLIEVMITLTIVAFGLLGVAGLQSKMSLAEMESYQRAQAVLTLSEMVERMNANRAQVVADAYNTAAPAGTGDAQPADCTGIAVGPNRDLCEWSNALKGTGEQNAATAASVGAMQGGRGCIVPVQPQDPTLGICTAGIYQVSVAWQGLHLTAAPSAGLACGQGLYGDERYRRVISAIVTVGTTSCF